MGKQLSKNFNESELACPCCDICNIQMRLVNKLQKLRDILGRPLIVTSGYRCPDYNERVNGKPNSSHVRGLGVDIACLNSKDRYSLIFTAHAIGFRRFGVYVAKKFVHLDIDETKEPEVIWGE